MRSLAVVAYTADPAKVRKHVVNEGWFDETEVVLLSGSHDGPTHKEVDR